MKIRLFAAVITLSLLTATSAWAVPATYLDGYVGGDPSNSAYDGDDRIGKYEWFEVSKAVIDWNQSTEKVIIDIYTTYVDDIGKYGTELGDLFLSDDGWNPYGSAPYEDDNMTNGEDWEYVFDLDKTDGTKTSGNLSMFSVINANIEASSAGGIYREKQEVQYNPERQTALATGSWAIFNNTGHNNDYLRFSMDLSNTNLSFNSPVGFHWGMTCGNDVIEGLYAVPEPSSLILLGLSVLGGVRLRRSKHIQ